MRHYNPLVPSIRCLGRCPLTDCVPPGHGTENALVMFFFCHVFFISSIGTLLLLIERVLSAIALGKWIASFDLPREFNDVYVTIYWHVNMCPRVDVLSYIYFISKLCIFVEISTNEIS